MQTETETTTAEHNKFTERQCRRFVITNRQLVKIFNGRVKIDDETLPADAEVGHVYVDFARNSIAVVVFSNEYPPVGESDEIPAAGQLGLRMYQYAEDQ